MAVVSEVTKTFVNQPMEGKPVNVVPGVGDAISGRLNDCGITTAKDLYKYYLDHTKSEFKGLVKDCGANSLNQKRAYNGMDEWHKQHGSPK